MVRVIGLYTLLFIFFFLIIAGSAISEEKNKDHIALPSLYLNIEDNSESYENPYIPLLLDPSENKDYKEAPHIISIDQEQLSWKKSRDIADSWGTLLIKSDPKLLNKTLILEYETNYGAKSEIDFLSQNRQYDLHRHRLNIKGNILDIEYGAKFNSFDNAYEKMLLVGISKEQPGKEIWIKKSFAFASLKTYVSDYIDTVNFDGVRPRTRKNQIGSILEFKLNNLPRISFSYSKGLYTKTQETEVLETTKNSVHNFNMYAYYWKPRWDVSIATNMYKANEKNQHGTKGFIKSIELSGTYRVIESISVNNTLGIVHEDYDWAGGGVNYFTQYTSLSLSYYPTNTPISISFYGYYSNYEGSDTYTDLDSFNGLAVTTLSLGKNFLGDQSLSFEVGYYGYMDNTFSANDNNQLTSYVKYQVASF